MDVQIVLAGAADPDELATLNEWLTGEPDLRGRVTPQHAPPAQGTLGPLIEALLVAVGPGSTAAALGASLVTWIRGRRGHVSVIVTRPDGTTITLEAKRVRDLDTAALSSELHRIVKLLNEAGPPPPTPIPQPNPNRPPIRPRGHDRVGGRGAGEPCRRDRAGRGGCADSGHRHRAA